MRKFVYYKQRDDLYHVGFFLPNGDWEDVFSNENKEIAEQKCNYLNGESVDNSFIVEIVSYFNLSETTRLNQVPNIGNSISLNGREYKIDNVVWNIGNKYDVTIYVS